MISGITIVRRGVWLALLAGMVALSISSAANAQTRPALGPSANPTPSSAIQPGKFDDQPVLRSGTAASQPSSVVPGSAASQISFQRIWLALAVVIAIIFALQWLSRRFLGGGGLTGSLKAVRILGRAPVSPKQQLVLIQIGRRLVLAANSGAQMNTLCELSDPEEVAALLGQLRQEKSESPGAFAGLFKRANKEFDSAGDEKQLEADSIGAPPTIKDVALTSTLSSTQQELSGLMEQVRRMSARQ